MKCFECGAICHTQYWYGNKLAHNSLDHTIKITHVNKACINCDWQSFKTKVPQPLT